MRFQTHQPVEDLHSGVFQIARPPDVRSFIKARFQFHHGGDFLALRCRNQGWNDQRMFAGAVKRLLDGKHAFVGRRRLNKRERGIVRIEGMMQQHIVLAKFFEQIMGLRGQPQFARRKGSKLQIGMTPLLVNVKQAGKIYRAIGGKNLPASPARTRCPSAR